LSKNEKHGFSDRTQGGQISILQGAKSVLEKGQKRAKGPKEIFGANKCYLEPNFWNLVPKWSTWQPCAVLPV